MNIIISFFRKAASFSFGMAIIGFFLFPGSIGLSCVIPMPRSVMKNPPWLGYTIITISLLYIFLLLFCNIFDFRLFFNNLKKFTLNKIFFVFSIYLFFNWLIYNYYHTITPYSVMCLIRLFIFFCMIMIINLAFSLNDKANFFRGCECMMWIAVLVGIVYWICPAPQFNLQTAVCERGMLSRVDFAISYLRATKYPMLLIFVSLFILIKSQTEKTFLTKNLRLLILLICILILNFKFSFLGKRSGYVQGIFCLLVCMSVIIRIFKKQHQYICIVVCLSLLTGCFYKIAFTRNYTNHQPMLKVSTFMNDRINLVKYLQSDKKVSFFGSGHGSNIQFFHNASLDLLYSAGILGLSLWLSSFIYLVFLTLKKKAYDLVSIILLASIILYYLNSCFTGFYLYFVCMYFMMYYLEFKLKNFYKHS